MMILPKTKSRSYSMLITPLGSFSNGTAWPSTALVPRNSTRLDLKRYFLLSCILGFFALWPLKIRASNEDDFFVGNRAAMTAGSVTATVDDGSAAYYNHAGLATSKQNRLDVSASVYSLRFYSAKDFIAVTDGPSTDADVTEFITIPTQIAYVRRISDTVSLGLGYFDPRSVNALLSERLEVTHDSGVTSQWALDTRVTGASYWFVAALGLHLSQSLRLGFGLFGVYDSTVESITLFGSKMSRETTERVFELSILGTSTQISSAPGIGIQLDLSNELTIGLWMRGPRLQIANITDNSVNSVIGIRNIDGTAELDAISESTEDDSVQIGFVTLGRYCVALAYRLQATTLLVEADLQPGLSNSDTGTERRFTLNARGGVTHAISRGITLGFGIFSDRATESSQTISKADFYGVTTGIELEDVLGLARGTPNDSLILTSVFAFRYAYGSGPSDTLFADSIENPTDMLGHRNGTQTIHEFGLHVGSALEF